MLGTALIRSDATALMDVRYRLATTLRPSTSGSTNLVPGDTYDSWDVFVRDLQTGAVTRVSTDASDHQGNAERIRTNITNMRTAQPTG
jgi:hypothetical protein